MSILRPEFSRSQRTGFDRITNTVAQPRAGRLRAIALAVYKTNEDDGPTKSSAGKRKIGLPAQLVQLLEDHRREQDQERAGAGQLWVETGRVFTDRFGRAVKPNSDYHAWKSC